MSEFSETTPKPPENNLQSTEYKKNIIMLERESHTLSKVYEMAVEYDPRLQNVVIVPEQLDGDGKFKKPFFARKPWKSESGKAEVHILFGDSEKIGKIAVDSVIENPDFKDQVRKMIYTPKGIRINKNVIRGFAFLHELGHVSDYYDHINNPQAYDDELLTEKNSLPLGYVNSLEIRQMFNKNSPNFQQKIITIFGNLENAIAKYRELRHKLPFEKKADEFASTVLRQNPTKLIALENYKN